MLVAFLVVAVGMFFALRFVAGAAGFAGIACCEPGFRRCAACGICRDAAGVHHACRWLSRARVDSPISKQRERLYFFEVVPLATVVFAIVFHAHLLRLLEQHGFAGFLLFSVLTGLLWGMVQEFLYRGWLQTELTRRFGALIGLLAANVAFTFGPLRISYHTEPGGVRWGSLAAVFGIEDYSSASSIIVPGICGSRQCCMDSGRQT